MSRKRTVFSVAAISFAATVGMLELATAAVNDQITDFIKAADTDGNGAVDRSEWEAHGQTAFGTMDADGNGSVSEAEFMAAQKVAFEGMDANGDGKLVLEPNGK